MQIFGRSFFEKAEQRGVKQSSDDFFAFFGLETSGANVNIDNALGVPAIWAAVQFLAGTLAGVPTIH